MCRLWRFLFVVCFAGCLAVTMTTRSSLFALERRTNVRMLYTADQLLYRSSFLACAADCSYRPDTCFSYSYSKQNQTCRLGSWLVPDVSTVNTNQSYQYTSGSLCNTTANFTIYTNGGISVCLWYSTTRANYTSAQENCKAKGAQLYTFKTEEKYNILLNIYNNTQVDTYVGLNDMLKEGELMWDDGTTLIDSWKAVIFKPGLPDDRGGYEDCVQLNSFHYPLNDIFCNNSRKYICEINPTGF